jgi:NUMOD3 motif
MNLYLSNKYTKYYYNIINRATTRILVNSIYTEKHHIIPKSLNGDNSKLNLVKLTAREHFICHLLLTKMTTGLSRTKMIHAIWRMCCIGGIQQNHRSVNSHTYQLIRQLYISQIKGRSMSDETKQKLRIANLGKKASESAREKMSISRTGNKNHNFGKPVSDSRKEKQSIAMKGKQCRLGAKLSDESKKLIAFKATTRIKLNCPHCNRLIDPANYSRYHGDKCKLFLCL